MTYAFSTTQNNGRIVSSSDAVTGENVSYAYDSLNRLISAATTNTSGVQWGDSYTYDGFGNLTSKVSTMRGTSAPSVTPQVNSANNQARVLGDYGFDANGNWLGVPESAPLNSIVNTYNVENQLISTGTGDGFGDPLTYTYDPWGKRVLQASASSTYGPTGTLYFYSITGQRLATYQLDYMSGTQISVNIYFGGRLLAPVDRLGSVRGNPNGAIAYYPWGEERTSTPNATDKYATYFRDAVINGTGQDYAGARYYNNNFGRFWSPDTLTHAKLRRPQSWNQYQYAGNDPVNHYDPSGRDYCDADGNCVFTVTGTGSGDDSGDEGDEDSDLDVCMQAPTYPGCGGARSTGASAAGIQQGNHDFGQAYAALTAELGTFYEYFMGTLDPDCSGDLTASGVTASQIATASLGTTILNGLGLAGATISYAQAGYGNTLAFNAVSSDYGTISVAQYMTLVDPNTAALAQLNGSNVYINAAWINGMSQGQQQGLLVHEILHNITGQGDSQLQDDLGLPQTPATQNISDKIQKDCFK